MSSSSNDDDSNIDFGSDDYDDTECSMFESEFGPYDEFEDYKMSDDSEEKSDELRNMTDLSPLFTDNLSTLAAQFHNNPIASPLEKFYKQISDWMQEKYLLDTDVVLLHQFKWMMGSLGLSEDSAIKIFHLFDSNEANSCPMGAMTEFLNSYKRTHLVGCQIITRHIHRLLTSSLMPGLLDIYDSHGARTAEQLERMQQTLEGRARTDNCTNSTDVTHGGENSNMTRHAAHFILGVKERNCLTQFLKVNRMPSELLPFQILQGYSNKLDLRLAVLAEILKYRHADVFGDPSEYKITKSSKVIKKCYQSIDVSSNKSEVHLLTNGNDNNYWQSNGFDKPHWIRLIMKPDIIINRLSVVVHERDLSFLPEVIGVSVGKTVNSLTEIKETRVSVSKTGSVVLAENLTTYYKVVQINIKRSHSGGSDTRIHQVKILGYRTEAKEKKPSVIDAVHVWYLQVLSAFTFTALPSSLALRATLLQHTQSALEKIAPLSISPTTPNKKVAFGADVLVQMEQFINDLSHDCDGVLEQGFWCKLHYDLARGCVNGLLHNLHQLLLRDGTKFTNTNLVTEMLTVRDKYIDDHSKRVSMSLYSCDGGKLNDSSGPANVLSATRVHSNAYMTEEGTTKVNMVFAASELLQLTRIKIKVCTGDRAPKMAFIFVFTESEICAEMEERLEPLEKYDTWTMEQYQDFDSSRLKEDENKEDLPVACLSFENTDEITANVPSFPIGKYVVVKFVKARVESSSHLELSSIKFYGHPRTASYSLFQMKPVDPSLSLSSREIVHTFLSFMLEICSTQSVEGSEFFQLQGLALASNPLDALWALYSYVSGQGSEWSDIRLLALTLTYTLSQFYDWHHHTATVSSDALLQHLHAIVDNDTDIGSQIHSVAKNLIADRPEMFYPNTDLRRQQLFDSLQKISGGDEKTADKLVVKGLCHYFTSSHPRALLTPLNSLNTEADAEEMLSMLQGLFAVCVDEFTKYVASNVVAEHHRQTTELVCTLQTGIMSWCIKQLRNSDGAVDMISAIVDRYVIMVVDSSLKCFQALTSHDVEDLEDTVTTVDHGILPTVLSQLLMYLQAVVKHVNNSTQLSIMKNLKLVNDVLNAMAKLLPGLFLPVDDEDWITMGSHDTVLQEWTEESPHPITRGFSKSREYVCPEASHFEVTFDQKSELDSSADSIDFHTSLDVKQHFESLKKHKVLTFNGGHKLNFRFMTTESSQKWGYKFKVQAKGSPDIDSMQWPFDLQLSLAKLFGYLCSQILDKQKNCSMLPLSQESDGDVLGSELWTTLFRGGYLVGKVQRTLSGRITTEDDDVTNQFLWDMVGVEAGAHSRHFLAQIKEKATKTSTPCLAYVDAAISAIYSAILWHTQQLRCDLRTYALSKINEENIGATILSVTPVITDGLVDAYNVAESLRIDLNIGVTILFGTPVIRHGLVDASNVAESLRIDLMSKQQKWKAARADGETIDDTTSPVELYKAKALYLRKFAGLTNVQLKTEMKRKLSRQKKSYSTEHLRATRSEQDLAILDKYPSIRLILDFISDPAWTVDRVHSMLAERSRQGQSSTQVYQFASEFLERLDDQKYIQLSGVVFLRELSRHEDTQPRHYADGLDGCGLTSESELRKAYYGLVTRLLAIQWDMKESVRENAHVASLYEFIQATALHFIDIPWQDTKVTAHEVRALAASQLYLMSGSVEEVMKACYWKSDVTFCKFYLRDMSAIQEDMKVLRPVVTVSERPTYDVTIHTDITLQLWERCLHAHVLCRYNTSYNYDLQFVLTADLATFYTNILKDAMSEQTESRSDQPDRTRELDVVNRHSQWLINATKDSQFTIWYNSIRNKIADKKDLQMFIAKYSDVLDVEIFCDGCESSLSGRRYRCLQCDDVDLCAVCFATGMTPEKHSRDHDMVHLAYQCDNCTSFIVGTRISCQMCEDFDLCLGCYTNKEYPPGHTDKHDVAEHAIAILRTKTNKSLLQSYCQLRAWLQLAALLRGVVQLLNTPSIDEGYHHTALSIHGLCVSQLMMGDLSHIPTGPQQAENLAEKRQHEDLTLPSREKIMGLLGILIPAQPQGSTGEQQKLAQPSLSVARLMDILLTLAQEPTEMDIGSRHMAVSLLGRLILTTAPSSCDEAVLNVERFPPVITDGQTVGSHTVTFLVNLGVKFLRSGKLEFVCLLVDIVQKMFATTEWNEAVNKHIAHGFVALLQPPEQLTFTLFVMAGFPQLCTRGSLVMGEAKNEMLVVEHYYNSSTSLVIDVNTRNKQKLNESKLRHRERPCCLPSNSTDTTVVRAIMDEVKSRITTIKHACQDKSLKLWQVISNTIKDSKDQQSPVSEQSMVGLMWYLRVLARLIGPMSDLCHHDDDLLKCIVFMASQETEFSASSLHWLEVHSLVTTTSKEKVSKSHDGKLDSTRTTHTSVPYSNLPTVVAEAAGDQVTTDEPDAAHPLATSVPPESTPPLSSGDPTDPTQIPLPHGHTTMPCHVTPLQHLHHRPSFPWKTVVEETSTPDNLMQSNQDTRDADNKAEGIVLRKANLLMKDSLKTHTAACILHCRDILFRLLSDLPLSGEAITTELLGYTDTRQVLCILDLLSHSVSQISFRKVLQKLFEASPKENIETFMSTACQFLQDHVLCTYTFESDHPYKSGPLAYQLHCPDATVLRVNFHKSCSVDSKDSLIIGSSDFARACKSANIMSGSGPWNEITIQGNTAYITLETTGPFHDSWGYQFTVTASRSARFETGYVFLSTLLDSNVCKLSVLNEIWQDVVYIACTVSGSTRLQCITLLLKILDIHTQSDCAESERLNLHLLQPLWKLFCSLELFDQKSDKVQLSLVRAMSQLFSVVETLAMKYGMATEYLLSLRTSDDYNAAIVMGLCHVASVSLSVGLTNIATISLLPVLGPTNNQSANNQSGNKSKDVTINNQSANNSKDITTIIPDTSTALILNNSQLLTLFNNLPLD